MDTRSLELFLQLAESLSFSRTAEQMHLSLSAVSRSVQRMEAELGQRLFERDKRSVSLTRAGEQFREYARRSLEDWQQLSAGMRFDRDNLEGEVSVYCSVTASYSVLSPILELFRQEYPGIEIMLHTGDQADAVGRVQAGKEDIAVAACPDHLANKLDFLELMQSPLQFIAPNFACTVKEQLEAVSATKDWGEIPFIVAERGLSKDRLDDWVRGHSVRPRIYAQVAGHEAIAAMVGLGLGVGVIPRLVLDNSTYKGKLQTVPVQPALGPFAVGLCALKQRLESPLVRAFWDVAQRSYKAIK
jgi:LysR family positive regulator for ilvC